MTDEVADLLCEIRDGQQSQLERQAQALAVQREQFELVRGQFERAEGLQARAEAVSGPKRRRDRLRAQALAVDRAADRPPGRAAAVDGFR